MTNYDILKIKLLLAIFPLYIRVSLIGGSILLIFYLIQTISGLLLGLVYS
jgi:hypothetical protein